MMGSGALQKTPTSPRTPWGVGSPTSALMGNPEGLDGGDETVSAKVEGVGYVL